MKIMCRTLFDCTRTGVTGHFKTGAMPFQDRAGQWVRTLDDWHRSRNQQRNFETLTQVLGLRTQLFDLTDPVHDNKIWQFDWQVESDAVYGSADGLDQLHGLYQDSEAIPMMIGLGEANGTVNYIITKGDNTNIWFDIINN